MSKIVNATFLIDEDRLISTYESYGIYGFQDALNAEFGVMNENGIRNLDWKVVKKENSSQMSNDRAIELLNAVIDHVSVANNSHETIKTLLKMGFTPTELVETFNWSLTDVREVEEEIKEE